MVRIYAKTIVAEVACDPGRLYFFNLLRLAQVVGQVWRATPRDNLTCGGHCDDVRAEPLWEVFAQKMLILLVDHDTGIFSESPHVTAAGSLLYLHIADFLNQIAKDRRQLLFLFPGESVIPGHLASASGIRLWSHNNDDLLAITCMQWVLISTAISNVVISTK